MSNEQSDNQPEQLMEPDPVLTHTPMRRFKPVSDSRRTAGIIREQIRSGKIELGASIGSVRDAAQTYDISIGAAKVAFEILRREGWLLTISPRDGHYVTSILPDPGSKPMTLEQRIMRLERHCGLSATTPQEDPDAS